MTVVIIEGADGAGKTTLARYLCEKLAAEHVPMGPPEDPKHAMVEYLERFEQIAPLDVKVFDRFHWGSIVYGEVFRGGPDITDREFKYIERRVVEETGCVILCSPPFEAVEANILERQVAGTADERGFEDSIFKCKLVYEMFDSVYSSSFVDKAIYDYTEQDPEDAFDFINTHLVLDRW